VELQELKEEHDRIRADANDIINSLDKMSENSERVRRIAEKPEVILKKIDDEFEKATSLCDVDVYFLLFTAMLQSIRWILLPELKIPQISKLSPQVPLEDRLKPNERSHKGGIYDGKSSGAEFEFSALSRYREKHSNEVKTSQESFYHEKDKYRNWIEILTQPVPYDAMNGLDKKRVPNIANLNLQNKEGFYNNIYAKNHHVATLGHDPVLGWLFGTANIMTSTISFVDFQHFEVTRGHKVRSTGEFLKSRELQFSDQVIDFLAPRGIVDILGECIMSAREDYKRVGAAVVRQAIHLASDKYCIEGLPIPFLSVIDPQKAQQMIEKGWNSVEFELLLKSDLKQIGISAGLEVLINMIIEAIYLLCLKSDDNMNTRKVKVKKIISIADAISSSSNILYGALTQNYGKLDIGGMGITMLSLLKSVDFKYQIKEEYLKRNFERIVQEG
jgi:hypothetical protein